MTALCQDFRSQEHAQLSNGATLSVKTCNAETDFGHGLVRESPVTELRTKQARQWFISRYIRSPCCFLELVPSLALNKAFTKMSVLHPGGQLAQQTDTTQDIRPSQKVMDHLIKNKGKNVGLVVSMVNLNR